MELQITENENRSTLLPIGKMCEITDYSELKTAVESLKSGKNAVVIDLGRVTFITSQGLGMFISLFKSLKKSGRKFILFNPRDDVRRTIVATGISSVIPIVRTEEELNKATTA